MAGTDELPFVDLTPESPDQDYHQHGERVMRRALALVRELAPEHVPAMEANRALMINIYGRDDLARRDQWIEKYLALGCLPVWMEVWEDRGVGQVLSILFQVVSADRTPNDVIREALGWGSA